MDPRGSVVRPRRVLEFDGGARARASFPGVIAYVKAGSGRLHRQFLEAARRLGVDAVERQCVGNDGRAEAWECVGPLDKLEQLLEHPAVSDWHLIIGVRVPVACGGSGTPSPAAEKRIAAGRREACDRAAEREAARWRNKSH